MPIIPVTEEMEVGKIAVGDQPMQKVSETPISTNKLGMIVHACGPIYMGDYR
jgi:hypothetical protein